MKNTIRERVARNDLVCQQCFVWKKARVVPVCQYIYSTRSTKVKVHKKRARTKSTCRGHPQMTFVCLNASPIEYVCFF